MQSKKTIGVLGANGVYGRHLVPRLIARGHRVRALVRRPEAASFARACGAEIHSADIFDVGSLRSALEGCDLAINLATALPGPSGRGDFDKNEHLRRNGTPLWVDACDQAGIKRMIQQSIGMVHATGSEAYADENSAPAQVADPIIGSAIATALAMEDMARRARAECLILRGGLFYGPGTGFDDDWFARAKAGNLRAPQDGKVFVSLVHIADMAEATANAADKWPGARTLIVCDDQPAYWGDVFAYVAELAGAPAPQTGGSVRFPSFRLKNARAKEALDWRPTYVDYRAGLAR